jgi:prepilin peptidase CpaA
VWVASAVIAVAAVTDYACYRIRNGLVVPVLLAAIVFHTFTGGLSGLLFGLQGMLVGFGMLFFLWLVGGMGAGDVKLLAAVGAWIGSWNVCVLFVATGLVLGVWVIVWAVCHCRVVWLFRRLLRDTGGLLPRVGQEQRSSERDRLERAVDRARASGARGEVIPFAVALFVGMLLAISDWNPLAL